LVRRIGEVQRWVEELSAEQAAHRVEERGVEHANALFDDAIRGWL